MGEYQRNFEREDYEKRLWKKVEEVSVQKDQLKENIDRVYDEVQQLNKNIIANQPQIMIKEKEYWEMQAELKALTEVEEEMQQVLLNLSTGQVDKEKINELLGEVGVKISKKKLAILKEEERIKALGERYGDESEVERLANDPSTTRLTTGRHAKSIKGNISTADAETVFYQSTTDTHGGKVGHGKDGSSYSTKTGKIVRKK